MPQTKETILQEKRSEFFTYRYSYMRAKETQDLNESGQDFLAFQDNGNSSTFVLCDGVGMSFHGEIAAKFLGMKLLHLFEILERDNAFTMLNTCLQNWTEEGREEVKRFSLPKEIPWLLRDVLEEKRKQGSESMFLCGKVEITPNAELANVTIITHGDSYVYLFQDWKKYEDCIEGKRSVEKRWSTHRGIIGGDVEVFFKTLSRKQVNRIVIHSDGLMALTDYHSKEILKEIQRAQRSPTSDDISFLDISW